MVELVRQGASIRAVARRFHVAPNTVHLWVKRSTGLPLPRMNWADRSRAPHHVHNRTGSAVVERVVACRQELASPANALGFIGAQTLYETLRERGEPVPSPRTIGRILQRHGMLTKQPRRRFAAPPTGWYLPDVAQGRADLDAFDVIEGLVLAGHGPVEVLTALSVWAPSVHAWPSPTTYARQVIEWLLRYWRAIGLPAYAQFDNDTRFQGGHNHPDVIGRVARACLALGVTPVFTPPRETGFQAGIEHFNGLWQAKVWHRLRHEHLAALCACSQRFVEAYGRRRAARIDRMPPRRAMPPEWRLDLQRPPRGQLIYLRRTDEDSCVSLLGRRFPLQTAWPHRLVRCEVDLDQHVIRLFGLRRRDPADQPLLATCEYHLPARRFRE